jgi:hypothetical protein
VVPLVLKTRRSFRVGGEVRAEGRDLGLRGADLVLFRERQLRDVVEATDVFRAVEKPASASLRW